METRTDIIHCPLNPDGDDISQFTSSNVSENEKVLCNFCGRSQSNGIRCIGKCLSESEY